MVPTPVKHPEASRNEDIADIDWDAFIDPALLTDEPSGHPWQQLYDRPGKVTGDLLVHHPAVGDGFDNVIEHQNANRAHGLGPALAESPPADHWLESEMMRIGVTENDVHEMLDYARQNGGRLLPLAGQEHLRQFAHLVGMGEGMNPLWPAFEIREHHENYANSDDGSGWYWYA
jgi:hypothetical protein